MERGNGRRIGSIRKWGPAFACVLLAAMLSAPALGADDPAPGNPGTEAPGAPGASPAASMDAARAFAAGESLANAEPASTRLFDVWRAPHRDLSERVDRTVRTGHLMGIESLEAPARALLLDASAGSAAERATAAVRLAPHLPAAHAALAQARRADGDWPGAAASLERALRATTIHPDARLWVEASGLAIASRWLAWSGFAFLLLGAAAALPDLVARLSAWQEALPAASWLALAGAVVLVPVLLGEGPLGLAVGASALAATRASFAHRLALVAACAALVVGLFAFAGRSADSLAALGSSHVARSALAVERGTESGGELARVRYASEHDLVAARAAALHAKRAERLDEAWARFEPLLEDASPDLLNNAANVALAQGRIEDAVALYERSSQELASPVILFNLSQAYGASVRIDAQDLALAEAQAIDADRVHELTVDFSHGRTAAVADMPLPLDDARSWLRNPEAAEAIGRLARSRLAPGALGANPVLAGGGLGVGIALGVVAGGFIGSRRRRAPRGGAARGRASSALGTTLQRAAGALVPGAAGLVFGRPLLGLAATLAAAAAGVLAFAPPLAPDPFAVGTLPALVLPLGIGAAAVLYGIFTLLAWRLGRDL